MVRNWRLPMMILESRRASRMSEQHTHLPAQRARRTVALLICVGALQACATERGAGFYLPEGDADRGRQAVVELKCQACHEINGFASAQPSGAVTRVRLGGHTNRVRTYGDLVTSIVNPSHRIVREYPRATVTTD